MNKFCLDCKTSISYLGRGFRRCTPCAKLQMQKQEREWRHSHLERKSEIQRAYYHRKKKTNPIHFMLYAAKVRARKHKLKFDLKEKDLVMPTHCSYLGIPIRVSRGLGPSPNSPSLDRVDVSKGYVPGNVEIISSRANSYKNNLSLSEMELMAKAFLKRVKAKK